MVLIVGLQNRLNDPEKGFLDRGSHIISSCRVIENLL